MEAIYAKLTATIILNGEILEVFFILLNTTFYQYIKIKYETMVPNFTTSIQYSTLSSSQSSTKREGNKRDRNKEREFQVPLFANDMILCMSNPEDSSRKFPKPMNTFSKVVITKLTCPNQYPYYTKDRPKEVRGTILFTVTFKINSKT